MVSVYVASAAAASVGALYIFRRWRLRPFPRGFLWATATAAYQVEGAADVGGRSPSTWDVFCHKSEGAVANGDSGDEACLFYFKYPVDVALAARAGGVNPGFRLSLSWSRIVPARGKINEEGISFYRRVLDELREAGVRPMVTLFHWDTPQWCEEEYGGWSDERIVADFSEYAKVVFSALGDRVSQWLTINEPWVTANFGYGTGAFAPGKRDTDGRATYRVGHHQLLAHAAVCQLYRSQFHQQGGRIGIALNGLYFSPADGRKKADVEAAQRGNEFELGWFADPLYFGDYPQVMRDRAGERLPTFSPEQKEALKLSKPDFFALNHYTSNIATDAAGFPNDRSPDDSPSYWTDTGVAQQPVPGATQASPPWLQLVPWGLRNQLVWIHDRYGGPEIIITENGCACPQEGDWAPDVELQDGLRQRQIVSYLNAVWEAVCHYGVNVTGYTYWSLMDNFEWADGYNYRFGLLRVDFTSKSKVRKEKGSFQTFAAISAANAVRRSPAGGPRPHWR